MKPNSIHVDLLGCQTRMHRGRQYTTRLIEAGSGPALILMHGGGGHAEAYSRNIARLADRFRVMAIDFVWHGFSSSPPFREGNWLKEFTLQVLDLMDSMNIGKASFEGESLGGWVAMDLGIHHPERVEKLVLNTAWGGKFKDVPESAADYVSLRKTSFEALEHCDEPRIRKRMEWLMAPDKVTDEIVAVRRAIWSRPQTNRSLTEYFGHLFDGSCGPYLFDEAMISRIAAPTLLLWTDRNPLHGVEAAHRFHQLISGSHLHIVKNAAHWPQWEQPEEHDRVVLDFLARAKPE